MTSKKMRKKKKNSKLSPTNKGTLIKRAGGRKKPAVKSKSVERKLVVSKKAPKKAVKKVGTKRIRTKTPKKVRTKRIRAVSSLTIDESEMLDTTVLSSDRIGGPSGVQAGDLQGLSGVEIADSQSVE